MSPLPGIQLNLLPVLDYRDSDLCMSTTPNVERELCPLLKFFSNFSYFSLIFDKMEVSMTPRTLYFVFYRIVNFGCSLNLDSPNRGFFNLIYPVFSQYLQAPESINIHDWYNVHKSMQDPCPNGVYTRTINLSRFRARAQLSPTPTSTPSLPHPPTRGLPLPPGEGSLQWAITTCTLAGRRRRRSTTLG